MPHFVMIGWDGPEGAGRRDRLREQHIAHVHELAREGRIVFAGPIRDDANERSIGVVIILEADSLKEVRQLIDRDPYVAGGVFKSMTVNPFKQVIPDSR
ncbi:MAG: hypothetical protein JSU86_19420 [Phycisphaerales bacterium]|nr:MAG: hypothetical protein JSU86_19420 [Phycisphaerales bacterium]